MGAMNLKTMSWVVVLGLSIGCLGQPESSNIAEGASASLAECSIQVVLDEELVQEGLWRFTVVATTVNYTVNSLSYSVTDESGSSTASQPVTDAEGTSDENAQVRFQEAGSRDGHMTVGDNFLVRTTERLQITLFNETGKNIGGSWRCY